MGGVPGCGRFQLSGPLGFVPGLVLRSCDQLCEVGRSHIRGADREHVHHCESKF